MSEWQHPIVTAIRGQLRRQELAADRILTIVGSVVPDSAPSTTKRVAMFALAAIATDRRILEIHHPVNLGGGSALCDRCANLDELGNFTDQLAPWPCETVRAVAAQFPDLDADLLR